MNSKNPTIPAVNSPPHETPRGAAAGTNQHGASDNSQRPSVSLNCRLAMWRKNSTLEIYCFSSALCFPLDEFFFVLPIFIPFYRACWTMETAKTRIIFHWSQRLASGQTHAVYSLVPRISRCQIFFSAFFLAQVHPNLPVCAGSELWLKTRLNGIELDRLVERWMARMHDKEVRG